MYSSLVFVHVASALLLGSFLAFPFVLPSLLTRAGKELKLAVQLVTGFVRVSHYALILLVITGGWMVIGFAVYPSLMWVVLSLLLLLVIGALIGMIQKNLKRILHEKETELALSQLKTKLKTLGWISFVCIIAVVFIMTNRGLFT